MPPRKLNKRHHINSKASNTAIGRPLGRAIHLALLGMALTAPLSTALLAQPAWAQTAPELQFDIPAGTLESALAQFASTAGVTLSFEPGHARGRQSAGLQGRYTTSAALQQLLAGSGLQAVRQANGSYSLVPAPMESDAVLELRTITVTGQSLNATTEGTGSYTTGETASATRLPLSLRKTPQSVSVVTRQRMDDQHLQSVSEVLKFTPGITVNQESSEAYSFYSRGFTLENFQFDGVPSLSSDGGSVRDNYSIGNSLIYDRVEVLKGATGLVNGSGYPSGVVNLVRKRPTDNFQGHVGAGAGSWDKYTGEVDLSGPLTQSGNIRGRMVAGTQTQHSYVDYLQGDEHIFYGVLEADLTDNTMLTLGYDVQKNQDNGSTTGALPVFRQDGRTIKYDRDFNPADRWSWRNQDTERAFAELAHTFDNEWVLKGVVSTREYKSRELISGLSSMPVQLDNSISHGFYPGGASKFNTTSKEENLDLYARGPFTLGGRVHEALFGYSVAHTRATSKRYDGDTNPTVDDVFAWDGYGDKPSHFDWWSTFDIEARQKVGFAATILKPTDRLQVILGARVVDYKWKIDTINDAGIKLPADDSVTGEVVPYAGVTYDIDQYHTVYVSYTDVFKPQPYSLDISGKPLDPLTGQSYEIGIKGAYFDDRLNASLAVFELQQDNFAELAGTNPETGNGAYRAIQGVTTRGVEMEISGEVAKDLQLMAGYTFAESHDGDDKRVATNQPQHLFKLATNYRLPDDWHKVTVGGNVYWQSSTFFRPGNWYSTDDPNAKFKQKSYTLVGLVAGYDFTDNLKGSVNVNNLFDKHYYSGIGNYDTAYWGAPRNVMLNVKYNF